MDREMLQHEIMNQEMKEQRKEGMRIPKWIKQWKRKDETKTKKERKWGMF